MTILSKSYTVFYQLYKSITTEQDSGTKLQILKEFQLFIIYIHLLFTGVIIMLKER